MNLRWRWTLVLSAVSASLLLLLLGLVEIGVEAARRSERERWRTRVQSELDTRLRLIGLETLGAAEALFESAREDGWRRRAPDSDAQRRAREDRLRLQARRLGLDTVLLLDVQGRVLFDGREGADSHARVHPAAAFLQSCLPHSPVLWPALAPTDPARWRLGAVAPWSAGTWLVAGRALGDSTLRTLAGEIGLLRLRWAPSPRPEGIQELPAGWQLPPDAPVLVWSVGEGAAAAALRRLRPALLPIALVAGVFVLIVAPWVARGLGRPLERMAAGVDRLAARERGVRLEEEGPPEIRRLAQALNSLSADLERAEAEARAAERRAAWREIARRIAHEIRNVLSPLSLALDNVETVAGRDDPAARAALETSLRTAREQLESLSRLVGEFGEFARLPRPRLAEVEAVEVVEAARAAASAACAPAVFRWRRKAKGRVRVDAEQMRRALLNVLKNAAEAAPGLPVEIELDHDPIEGRWLVAVLDRGPGVPEPILRSLGKPYRSTKPGGTGLGLALVRRVVEAHGGTLDVRVREGGGARIELTLPIDPPLEAPASGEIGEDVPTA